MIALGEVRHKTEQLDREFFGVEFMELTDHHRAQIEDYIERRLREEHGPRRPVRPPPFSGPGDS